MKQRLQDNNEFSIHMVRMTFWSVGMTAAGTILLFFVDSYWAEGWFLGSIFNVIFFLILRSAYRRWIAHGETLDFIGIKISSYGFMRLPAAAILLVLTAVCTHISVFALVAGLLSLRLSIFGEGLRGVIKK